MKQLTWHCIFYLSILLGCFPSYASAVDPATQSKSRQLWQLLDYVAVDYPGAVKNGKIVSELEYEEMQEFSTRAYSEVGALAPHPKRDELARTVSQLKDAIERCESAQVVADLARQANRMLLAAYPFPVSPRMLPDLTRGAALYQTQCASCHGAVGAGDGPLAANLEPAPIAFTDHERARSRSLMALYQVISQGVADTSMPAFASLSEADRWSLAFFVGNMGYRQDDVAAGEKAFSQDAALQRSIADLTALVTVTEEELAKSLPVATARAGLAYARSNPGVIRRQQERSGIALARDLLQQSLAALRDGRSAAATELALSAYLDGFEPLEASLDATDRQLLVDVERTMQLYRGAVAAGDLAVMFQ